MPMPRQADRRLRYRRVDSFDLHLDVFVPAGTGPHPGICWFFGGGFQQGSITQFHPHATLLAERGIAGFCAEYRVAKVHGTPPEACVEDARAAMRFLRRHFEDFALDPHRLAAGGGSAGGCLAACCAVDSPYNASDDDLAVSPRPTALILFNPVVDVSPQGYAHDRVADWRRFSPLHNLATPMPPSLFLVGDQDHLVPLATAHAWRDRCRQLGAEAGLHLTAAAGHGFFNWRDGDNPWFTSTMAAVAAFTDRHLLGAG